MTQTFLPHADFSQTAKTLDNRRLNSSINEGYEAYLFNLGNPNDKPLRHPNGHCVNRLWKGHESFLRLYITALKAEASKNRGMKPMDTPWFLNHETDEYHVPKWFGSEIFHTLFQRHLLSKNSNHYSPFFMHEFPIRGYIAPDKNGEWKIYSSEYSPQAEALILKTFQESITISITALSA